MNDYTFQDVNGFGASPDGLGLPPLGATVEVVEPAPNPLARTLKVAYSLASIAGAGMGAYHGYKRNNSWGWALGWAVLGSLVPVITIPVSFAQGFGKRKH
jgi:hypothetical protein